MSLLWKFNRFLDAIHMISFEYLQKLVRELMLFSHALLTAYRHPYVPTTSLFVLWSSIRYMMNTEELLPMCEFLTAAYQKNRALHSKQLPQLERHWSVDFTGG